MSELRTIVPKQDHPPVLLKEPCCSAPEDPKQRKLMVGALCLLLLALGIVLWHDRDFWFPDAPQAENQIPMANPASTNSAGATSRVETAAQTSEAMAKPHLALKPKHQIATVAKAAPSAIASSGAPESDAPMAVTTSRTVLPPLEVEVVAGDMRRTIRPGNSSVRLDLQPGVPAQGVTDPGNAETAANVTTNAAEHVQMSVDTSEIVTRPARPDYPLLARQMKVQGSVILEALIGKDGVIQNLRVVSGPRILASAAEDAVRQWHFKPHFQGTEAVETQAKITVNFTISTN